MRILFYEWEKFFKKMLAFNELFVYTSLSRAKKCV